MITYFVKEYAKSNPFN